MNWLNVLVAIVGIAGFLFGLFQYWKAQKWKRMEYAANLLQRITKDDDLRMAIIFLEYSKRPVQLPEKYRKLAGTDVFEHDCEYFSRVLKIGHFETTPAYFIYRDSLNRLLEYLEQIYQFIDMGLIKTDDIKGLSWILHKLANPVFIQKTNLNKYVSQNYIYIDKLFELYDIAT